MPSILTDTDLFQYNTFGIHAMAQYFATFQDTDKLVELLNSKKNVPLLTIGGGSNILLTKDFAGLVLKNEIKGISLVAEDADYFYIKAGAGENWHSFVQHCIAQGYAGVENLSFIPGCVGASPMQNIGAYGVEIKDVFYSLEALQIADGTTHTFHLSDCHFGYRESVFKRALKGQFIILNVTYRLSKQPHYNISYGAIEQELEKMGIRELSIRAISDAVIAIRSSKLPDPKKIGNAGSFFKNPTIPLAQYEQLKQSFPDIKGFHLPDDKMHIKIAAGWLIEQCGWKGFRENNYGVHAHQALVLVNYHDATGAEIYALSSRIIASVEEKYGITLEREVNII